MLDDAGSVTDKFSYSDPVVGWFLAVRGSDSSLFVLKWSEWDSSPNNRMGIGSLLCVSNSAAGFL
jgi:hypothetical protein